MRWDVVMRVDMEKVLKNLKCVNCEAGFDVTDLDMKFYKRFDVPEPVECYETVGNRGGSRIEMKEICIMESV